MAIYHFSAQVVSRSEGRSSTSASAYRAGQKIVDASTGQIFDYTRKGGVFHSEILAPANAPAAFSDRSVLWNEVEKVERRKDAQLAREINVALPIELDHDRKLMLAREFVQEQFVSRGMIADLAIHDVDSNNPHFHVMLSMRDVDESGFGMKNRGWNDKALLQQWREAWENTANKHLELAGLNARIDHRSLSEQGIVDREPTAHLGPNASGFEKRTGRDSDIRRRTENAMRERAREAAALKVAEATRQAEIDAAEKELSALLDEYNQEQPPSVQASSDSIRTELEQARKKHAMDLESLEGYPTVRSAKMLAKTAQEQVDKVQKRFETMQAERLRVQSILKDQKIALSTWRRKHPFLSWFHKHVRPVKAAVKMQQLIDRAATFIEGQKKVQPLLENAVIEATQAHINSVASISEIRQSLAVELEKRNGTASLIAELERLLNEAEERERIAQAIAAQNHSVKDRAAKANQLIAELMDGKNIEIEDTPVRYDRPRF